MAMDINTIMKMKGAWDTFTRNHPKFPMFLRAITAKGIKEGTIIDINITDPDGTPIGTNIKVTSEDIELFEMLKNLRQ